MPIKEFATEEDAWDWLEHEVDDDCVDNYRFTFINDDRGMAKYREQQYDGCCGFFDAQIKIDGRDALIGCNYGH